MTKTDWLGYGLGRPDHGGGYGFGHNPNYGRGYYDTLGGGNGDGPVICTTEDGDGVGAGWGKDSLYATPLIINTDPLTMSYQAVTMQTLGDGNDYT